MTLTSARVTRTPVKNVKMIDTPSGKVGYLLFNDHNAMAEAQLIAAFNQFKSAGVVDLVLDMRYNGGGLLYIASELAYMIGRGRHGRQDVRAPAVQQQEPVRFTPAQRPCRSVRPRRLLDHRPGSRCRTWA